MNILMVGYFTIACFSKWAMLILFLCQVAVSYTPKATPLFLISNPIWIFYSSSRKPVRS